MSTTLLYMDGFDIVTCQATVTDIKSTEDKRKVIILDQTCFYPRGGGQDWDTGTIRAEDGSWKIEVSEVRLDDEGLVHHYIEETAKLEVGETVQAEVNQKRRNINTRLHSAGHVLDMAMSGLRPDLIPGKGAHYPHMSFVEYEGAVENPDELTKLLQTKIDEILSRDTINTLKFVNVDELKQLCRHESGNLPTNKPIRVVLYDDFAVPCGGTHVQKLKDTGTIEITKLRSKKGITKVSYHVEGIN